MPQAAAVHIAIAIASIAACTSAHGCADCRGLGTAGARASALPRSRWPHKEHLRTAVAAFTNQVPFLMMRVDRRSGPPSSLSPWPSPRSALLPSLPPRSLSGSLSGCPRSEDGAELLQHTPSVASIITSAHVDDFQHPVEAGRAVLTSAPTLERTRRRHGAFFVNGSSSSLTSPGSPS